jgi:hypothetical protein
MAVAIGSDRSRGAAECTNALRRFQPFFIIFAVGTAACRVSLPFQGLVSGFATRGQVRAMLLCDRSALSRSAFHVT